VRVGNWGTSIWANGILGEPKGAFEPPRPLERGGGVALIQFWPFMKTRIYTSF